MSWHTSGPWTVDPGQGDYMGAILGASGVPVCTFGYCTTYYPVEGDPPTDADARLIASAPDLLEALLGIAKDCRRGAHESGMSAAGVQDIARRCDEAIAKATGGEA